MGSLSLLQGIFPTQGSNPGLPHCRGILYQLSHKGIPRMLDWVANPFSSGMQADSLPTELSEKPCLIRGMYTVCVCDGENSVKRNNTI